MSAYTNAMVTTLTANAPYNYDSASAFASQHGLSVRSVISKVKSLGLEYVAKPKAASKPRDTGPTKAETLAGIRSALGMPAREGELTKAELVAILASLA